MLSKSLFIVLALAITLVVSWSDDALKDKIKAIPNQPSGVNFEMFGGHLPSKANNEDLYYIFHTASSGMEAPVLVTLGTGPSCSGTMSSWTSTGPFSVQDDQSVFLRPYRLNRMFHTVYVDPPGVGYSMKDDSGREVNDDYVEKAYIDVISRFFEKFPEISKNKLFLTNAGGYGSHYVLRVAKALASEGKLNMSGIIVQSPVLTPKYNTHYKWSTLANYHMLPYFEYKTYAQNCGPQADDKRCLGYEEKFASYVTHTDIGAINFPFCPNTHTNTELTTPFTLSMRGHNMENPEILENSDNSENSELDWVDEAEYPLDGDIPADFTPCSEVNAAKYLSKDDVKEALRAKLEGHWKSCEDFKYKEEDLLKDARKLFGEAAVSRNINILVLSGDNDALSPVDEVKWGLGTTYSKYVDWSGWTFQGERGGYRESYRANQGLVHLFTIRGAGNDVFSTRPSRAYYLVQSYINGRF